MTAPNTLPNPNQSLLPARAMIICGLVSIAVAFVNYLGLLIPFEPLDQAWQQSVISRFVDLGIVPFIGIGFIFWGFWIEERTLSQRLPRRKFKIAALSIAFALGVIFLVASPLHLFNVWSRSREVLAQITSEARSAEEQVEQQVQSEAFRTGLEQRQQALSAQAEALLKDEDAVKELLEGDELNEEQKNFLRQAQSNPEQLQAFIAAQADRLPLQLIGRIRERRQQLDERARVAAFRSGLQTGISGLMLSAGYITLGATAFRSRPARAKRKGKQKRTKSS
ncbi:MAG: HpsJ family protein [Cyanobacteria bacterium P01_H01_bin.130]